MAKRKLRTLDEMMAITERVIETTADDEVRLKGINTWHRLAREKRDQEEADGLEALAAEIRGNVAIIHASRSHIPVPESAERDPEAN